MFLYGFWIAEQESDFARNLVKNEEILTLFQCFKTMRLSKKVIIYEIKVDKISCNFHIIYDD